MSDAHGRPAEPEDRGPLFDATLSALQPSQAFVDACGDAGIAFEGDDLARLGRYLAFLRDANAKINLTTVVDPDEMWMRHVYDSLTLLPFVASYEREDGADGPVALLDVGTGGGLPGLPLAIVLPDVQVTLLEATGKKVRFLEGVRDALGLANVRVVQARAEDAGRDRVGHRERYDIVTSRAVGALATLAELTVPFARVGGLILAIKGERADAEIVDAKAALHALHAHVRDPVRTPTGTVVPLVKQRSTPKLYPRRAGEPKRAPIGGRLRDE
jgi:16S rRNA (guanine527-N7)-methyltransferase